MTAVMLVQGGIAALYLAAVILLWSRQDRLARPAIALAALGFAIHFGLLAWRWHDIGQIPIVTRYEDLTVDSLMIVGLYLAVQWRLPELRQAGLLALSMAGLGLTWALFHNRDVFPMGPALRTNWLIIHAQLNSLAIGAGTLAAGVPSPGSRAGSTIPIRRRWRAGWLPGLSFSGRRWWRRGLIGQAWPGAVTGAGTRSRVGRSPRSWPTPLFFTCARDRPGGENAGRRLRFFLMP